MLFIMEMAGDSHTEVDTNTSDMELKDYVEQFRASIESDNNAFPTSEYKLPNGMLFVFFSNTFKRIIHHYVFTIEGK